MYSLKTPYEMALDVAKRFRDVLRVYLRTQSLRL